MCGRFTLKTPAVEIARQLGGLELPGTIRPRFNISPSQSCLILRHNETHEPASGLLTWGLRPRWVKKGSKMRDPINARAETVAEKSMFRSAYRKRRCLVPADGFYEWQKQDGAKIPWYFSFNDHAVFTLAGIWEHWRDNDETLETFALITTTANEILRPVHDRSPVIIAEANREAWLSSSSDPEEIAELLKPYPSGEMISHPVSRHVNSPKNDDLTCVKPVTNITGVLFEE